MIRLSGRLICTTHAQARAVMMGLPAHVRLTRAEPGCLSFDVVPTEDPLIWQVDEAFADRAALDGHQARAAGTDWAALTKDIARDYVITEDGTA
jgi:quinol monooxygenase YgiN